MEPAQFLLTRPSIGILDLLPSARAHLIKVHIWLHTGYKHTGCIEEAHQPAHHGRTEQEQDKHTEYPSRSRHHLCPDRAEHKDANVESLEAGCDHDHLFGRILNSRECLRWSFIPH